MIPLDHLHGSEHVAIQALGDPDSHSRDDVHGNLAHKSGFQFLNFGVWNHRQDPNALGSCCHDLGYEPRSFQLEVADLIQARGDERISFHELDQNLAPAAFVGTRGNKDGPVILEAENPPDLLG